jgi:hypothetical protein
MREPRPHSIATWWLSNCGVSSQSACCRRAASRPRSSS